MTSRLALHMVNALPLRSVWIGRNPPRRRKPAILHWWLKGALLVLASAVLVVVVAKILRAAL